MKQHTNNIYLNPEKAKRNNKNINKHSMIPTRKISRSIWQYLKITLLIIIYCTKLFETSTWYKHNFSCLIVYWHILIINNDFINTTNLYFTCALCNQRCHINHMFIAQFLFIQVAASAQKKRLVIPDMLDFHVLEPEGRYPYLCIYQVSFPYFLVHK